MPDHNVSFFAIAPEQYVMLGSREMYASIGGTEELVGGTEELVGGSVTPSKVTVSFDLGSRQAIDELIERAGAAGGQTAWPKHYRQWLIRQAKLQEADPYEVLAFLRVPYLLLASSCQRLAIYADGTSLKA